jgi:DNA-directed RNA polymerase subunit RPC12/RpoP
MIERLKALRASEEPDLEFWGNDKPKCPHCGADVDIERHDLSSIYEEGEHVVDCPYCNLEFIVWTRISHTFSTEKQES